MNDSYEKLGVAVVAKQFFLFSASLKTSAVIYFTSSLEVKRWVKVIQTVRVRIMNLWIDIDFADFFLIW